MEEKERALQLAIKYLSRFNVSSKKLINYLKLKGIKHPTATDVVSHLEAEGYIDDFEFAKSFIRQKKTRYGSLRLYTELLKRGVSREIAKEALESLNQKDEWETVKNLTFSFLKKNLHLERDKFKRRLVGFLTRRGFSRDFILAVFKDLNIFDEIDDKSG